MVGDRRCRRSTSRWKDKVREYVEEGGKGGEDGEGSVGLDVFLS